jgi:hypothetical protein
MSSAGVTVHPAFLTTCLCLLVISIAILQSCERPSHVEQEKKRTLTGDERYIVKLYLKITEIEENLQDNPEERRKKWEELRDEFEPARIQRILQDLEQDPKRWLAIYGRINEVLERREQDGST